MTIFWRKADQQDDDLPIVLRRLNFRYDFRVGGLNSLNFHQALSETTDEDCFTTDAVQVILRYKWE